MKEAVGIISLIFIGALAVLVITHPTGFATAAASGGTFIDNTAGILTGNSGATIQQYPGAG